MKIECPVCRRPKVVGVKCRACRDQLPIMDPPMRDDYNRWLETKEQLEIITELEQLRRARLVRAARTRKWTWLKISRITRINTRTLQLWWANNKDRLEKVS